MYYDPIRKNPFNFLTINSLVMFSLLFNIKEFHYHVISIQYLSFMEMTDLINVGILKIII